MERQQNRILIVGAGALGSHVAQFLRNTADLSLCDFDKVETKNTLSQFYAKNTVRKLKVMALEQQFRFLWGVSLHTLPVRAQEANILGLIAKKQLVIDCVDNKETRDLLQSACKEQNVPLLHSCLAANGEFGRIVWTERFQADSEVGAGAETCEDGGFLPFIVTVAALTALTGQTMLETGRRMGFEVGPDRVTRA